MQEQKIKITEIKVSNNYVLDTNNTKVVDIVWGENISLEFRNVKKKGKIKVIKVDFDNNEITLKGVKFNVLNSKNEIVETLITNDKGKAITLRLPIDEIYKVKEVSTLENYVLNDEVKTIKLTENQITNITFTNELKKGKIKIIKVDLYNNEVKLQGIEFKVLDEDNNLVDTLVTDKDGVAISKNLRIDKKYKIQETKTLKDNDLNNEIKTITLKGNEITNITFENELKKARIKIQKVDLDNNEIKLEGIEFKLFDEDKNLIQTLITDKNGEVISKKLRVDKKYILKKTKTLSNYVINDEVISITLSTDELKTIIITNEKIKGKIKVVKYSSEDNKYIELISNTPLENVVFEIIDSNNQLVDTIIINKDGIAITKDLLKGTYKVREIKQADYYLLNENVFEIEIKNHNEVIEQVVYNDSVDVDIEIEKTGFIETQNKDNIFYNFKNIHNKSNVSLDNFTWNGALPIEVVRLDKIYTGTWNEKLEYSVWYKKIIKKILNYLKIN